MLNYLFFTVTLSILLLPQSWSLQQPCTNNNVTNKKQQPSNFLPTLLLAGSYLLAGTNTPQQMANASPLPESSSSRNTIIVAMYASEGSGGLPFLSPFQMPGAKPVQTNPKYDNAEARNRAFDNAFDQDKCDRDDYYAKMALASWEKIQQLKQQHQALGLDYADSGPRFGDPEVASMASLKKQLSEKDPTTMTSSEFKEFQELIKSTNSDE